VAGHRTIGVDNGHLICRCSEHDPPTGIHDRGRETTRGDTPPRST
jgi:hypothetical protein